MGKKRKLTPADLAAMTPEQLAESQAIARLSEGGGITILRLPVTPKLKQSGQRRKRR